ncbi:MAG: DUF5103 domain-containing protein [Nonlabens sp.]
MDRILITLSRKRISQQNPIFIPYLPLFMKSFFLLVITLLPSLVTMAQTLDELVLDPDYIKTVTINKPPENMLPVFELGQTINITFDDVIGDEADYYYKLEHYNYDWTPSALFQNEWMRGIDDVRIFDYRNSFTTIQSYSHYTLTIPNQFTQALLVSGNYMIHFYNSDQELVFSRRFMIIEPQAQVGVEIKRARDLKYVNTQQRVQFFVDSQQVQFINPNTQLKVAIYQNADLDSAIGMIKPQFNLGNKQVYRYDGLTSFWAGNEYLNFENRDFRSPNLNIDYVTKGELYDAHLFIDGPRQFQEYTYFPDINGNFLVSTLTNEDPAVQSEYVNIHYKLSPEGLNIPSSAQVYVTGNYNAFQLQEENQMTYNANKGIYEATILQKQGFYNYRYTVVDKNKVDHGRVSGNKWQTENVYTVLAYYRELGGRYDRLIGMGSANSENITN